MFKMTSYIPKREEKPSHQEHVLEALLGMVRFWKREGLSKEETKAGIERTQKLVLAKFADEIDPSKINLQHVFSLLAKRDHFNEAEKGLIRTLLAEAGKLQKKFGEKRPATAKTKKRFKRSLDKKFI